MVTPHLALSMRLLTSRPAIIISLLLGAAHGAVAQLPKPPGRLIDIGGGQRIHLDCTGRGSPTVVFENGAGDFSLVWSLVQPRVAESTRACSYDRAGYAWSDPGAQPRTYDQLSLELHTALERSGERGPYVLVGQSYGGLVVRGFARRYAPEVVGMVLVDAVHEDQRVNMGGGKLQRIADFAKGRPLPTPHIAADSALMALRHSGNTAKLPPPLEPPLDRLSAADQKTWQIASADSVYRLSSAAEMDWSPEELAKMHADRVKNRATLGTLPLVVISRTVDTTALAIERDKQQADLAALSTRGRHVVAPRSGHNVHLEDPDLVTREIRSVIADVRSRP
jgi:pimeloyl-ACP methyl ester carboxylesterase